MLEIDELVPRTVDRADELIQLEVDRFGVAILVL
jgi:hypothetical protein